jgi:hypothetical protein
MRNFIYPQHLFAQEYTMNTQLRQHWKKAVSILASICVIGLFIWINVTIFTNLQERIRVVHQPLNQSFTEFQTQPLTVSEQQTYDLYAKRIANQTPQLVYSFEHSFDTLQTSFDRVVCVSNTVSARSIEFCAFALSKQPAMHWLNVSSTEFVRFSSMDSLEQVQKPLYRYVASRPWITTVLFAPDIAYKLGSVSDERGGSGISSLPFLLATPEYLQVYNRTQLHQEISFNSLSSNVDSPYTDASCAFQSIDIQQTNPQAIWEYMQAQQFKGANAQSYTLHRISCINCTAQTYLLLISNLDSLFYSNSAVPLLSIVSLSSVSSVVLSEKETVRDNSLITEAVSHNSSIHSEPRSSYSIFVRGPSTEYSTVFTQLQQVYALFADVGSRVQSEQVTHPCLFATGAFMQTSSDTNTYELFSRYMSKNSSAISDLYPDKHTVRVADFHWTTRAKQPVVRYTHATKLVEQIKQDKQITLRFGNTSDTKNSFESFESQQPQQPPFNYYLHPQNDSLVIGIISAGVHQGLNSTWILDTRLNNTGKSANISRTLVISSSVILTSIESFNLRAIESDCMQSQTMQGMLTHAFCPNAFASINYTYSASGVFGNVNEPYIDFITDPDEFFSWYARGVPFGLAHVLSSKGVMNSAFGLSFAQSR